MSKMSLAVLMVAALVVVAVLAAAFFFRASAPAAQLAPKALAVAPQSAAPVAARSVFVSEQKLQRNINEAAEHHWGVRGQALMQVLNQRHEHRCCGLPR